MSEQSSNHLELTQRGKRMKAAALAGAATTALIVGAPAVARPISKVWSSLTRQNQQPDQQLSRNKEMDIAIQKQLRKGPDPTDVIIVKRRGIRLGENITGIMIDTAPSTDYRNPNISTIQRKATVASNHTPEAYIGTLEGEPYKEYVTVWKDKDLEAQFGQAAILAIPEGQIERP